MYKTVDQATIKLIQYHFIPHDTKENDMTFYHDKESEDLKKHNAAHCKLMAELRKGLRESQRETARYTLYGTVGATAMIFLLLYLVINF